MALEKIRVLKQEYSALGGDAADDVEYPAPINPTEDAVEAGAYYLQEGGIDDLVHVKRASGHMVHTDAVLPVSRKLVDQLLEGHTVSSVGVGTVFSTSGSLVTEELVSIGATPLRRTTFTYASGEIDTVIIKVYAANGTTIIGQVTHTYNWATDPPAITMTRDV